MSKDYLRRLLQGITDVGSAGGLAAVGLALGNHQVGDPGVNAVLLASAQPFLVRVVEWLSDPKNRDELRCERDRDFFEEMQRQLAEVLERLQSTQDEVQRTKWRAITPEEALILIEQYRDHAARTAQDERRRLLAAAAAATFRPDIDIEMKSRAERALANLEPSDIAVLRALLNIAQKAQFATEIRMFYEDQPLVNRLMLEQVGCVAIESHLAGGDDAPAWGSKPRPPRLRNNPQLTPLGLIILSMLDTYKPMIAPLHKPSDSDGPFGQTALTDDLATRPTT